MLSGALFLILAPAAHAGTVPAGFQESTVFSGLTFPTNVRFSPDGRVFVAQKNGLIKVYSSLSATTPTIFADLRTSVDDYWDRGLLGLALDPSFPTKPYVYVLYTYDAAIGGTAPTWNDACPTPPGPNTDGCVVSGRLSRLTANGNVMTGSEQVLINDWCQQFPSHSLGDLNFGADGALYVTGGDGASFTFADYGQAGSPLNPCGDPPAGVGGTQSPPAAEGGALRAQDLRTRGDPTGLNGALLRVDPATGAALPTNPLAGDADPNARRIVAYGLRNPYRFTIRPGTNEVWIGDVGWNDWEEIDTVTNPTGGVVDFGWPCYEGGGSQSSYKSLGLNICTNLYATAGAVTGPYYTYFHGNQVVPGETCGTSAGSSITGDAFYNGGTYPAAYAGALFFGDYTRNCIWAMLKGTNGLPDPGNILTFDAGASNPVDLENGPGGDLYYVNHDGGAIQRIQYLSGNHAPTAVATANPTSGGAPLQVNFDGTGSSDPDVNDVLSYSWDLDGDGVYGDSTLAQPTFTYTVNGTYTVRLRVTDSHGAAATSSPLTVTVGGPPNTPPVPTISAPPSTLTWKVGDVIGFSGSATDQEEGTLPPADLTWALIIHHCPTDTTSCHTHNVQTFGGVASGTFVAPDHDYPSYLELKLTATDANGAQGTTSVRLDPQTVALTFASTPSGLQLAVGSGTSAAPFTRTVIVGSTNSISAPSPQALGGTTYVFSSWSDAAARSHDIVAPATPTSYTATFAVAPPSTVGLVAAYAFDEGTGTTAADASGNNNTGTVANTTWAPAGKFGSALSFNGSSSWVTVADTASLDLSSAMTLEAWVDPSATGTSWRTVLFKEAPGAVVYSLYANQNTGVPIGQVSIGGEQNALGTSTLPLNTWSHLAVSYDGATLRLYLNGTQIASKPVTGAMTPSTGPLHIGGNSIWNEWYAGLIDEIRVYNRALSATEIQTDMTTRVGS